jgi:Acyl-CoA reductase (LuxC)
VGSSPPAKKEGVVPQVTYQMFDVIKGVSSDAPKTGFPTTRVDELIWSRDEAGPAFDLPVEEVLDFLVETGRRLDYRSNRLLAHALEALGVDHPLGPRVLEHYFDALPGTFDRRLLEFELEQSLGGDRSAGWQPVVDPRGRGSRVRAFPPRLIHILPGNVPGAAATTIARASLSRGVSLMKTPSNDRFTAPAILQTMADIDASHPVTRSLSAVYWKGGDDAMEGMLFRPQYFDKLVAWGGESAIRGALRYIGPGLELVSFDPKVSISLIGNEAFGSDATLDEVAELAACDVANFNQEGCVNSRYQFVEGNIEQVDRYCERLVVRLEVDRHLGSARGPAVPSDIRDEVEILRTLEPFIRVWGGYDGGGLVVRSDEMVDFHPSAKTVNVIPVPTLDDAVPLATVATQTVGVYPGQRGVLLRDALASRGVQRIVALGEAHLAGMGLPHDGMYPLHRFMRWIIDSSMPDCTGGAGIEP